eukprot:550745_1
MHWNHLIVILAFISLCFTRCSALEIVAGKYDHVCVLYEYNGVKCWGNNFDGQLGYADTYNRGDSPNEMGYNLMPIDLGNNFNLTQITAGMYHSCSLSESKTVKCWGHNYYGQLGLGDQNDRGDGPDEMGDNLLTVDLGNDFETSLIASGWRHTCSLSVHHTVKCWGDNLFGGLGYGDTNKRGVSSDEMGDNLLTINVGNNFNVTGIAVGRYHTCVLSEYGSVKCWGYNKYGQLGYGDTENRGGALNEMGDNLLTIDLGNGFNVTQITLGEYHTCALSEYSSVKCWGYNVLGQLGYGDTTNRGDVSNEMGDNLMPIDLGNDFNYKVAQITTGEHHTCALSESNTVKCWGSNDYGQLGLGDQNNRGGGHDEMGDNLFTVDLGNNFNVTQITAGGHTTCALSEYNTIKCWGENNNGQLGYGDTDNRGDESNEMSDNLLEIDIVFGTQNPTKEPTQNPTSDNILSQTYDPTQFPTMPTLQPSTSPTLEPTLNPTELVVYCNFTSSNNTDCSFKASDSLFCCSYLSAVISYHWITEDEIATYKQSFMDQDTTLNAVVNIKNIQMFMLIIDSVLVAIVLSVTIIGYFILHKSSSLITLFDITVSAFGTFVDICLTIISIVIIVNNNLIHQMNGLYEYNCYDKDTFEEILGLKEQFNQVLILDSLEAVLDLIGLSVLIIGAITNYEKLKFCAESIHGGLFGLDWILTFVNFFAFVVPGYNSFIGLYNNDQMMCYQQIPHVDSNDVYQVSDWIIVGVVAGLMIISVMLMYSVHKYHDKKSSSQFMKEGNTKITEMTQATILHESQS